LYAIIMVHGKHEAACKCMPIEQADSGHGEANELG
jgi:hypothetical protein